MGCRSSSSGERKERPKESCVLVFYYLTVAYCGNDLPDRKKIFAITGLLYQVFVFKSHLVVGVVEE
jgi:hypothetical protein